MYYDDQGIEEPLPKNKSICSETQGHALFVGAIALGAFLIFLIQPLAARALLPAFGGSASVWVTALVFYQVLLAAGYLLAHFIHTHLTISQQKLILVLLFLGSFLTLSILPQSMEGGSDLPALKLFLSLTISVGPPFLVLAVAGPLVQGWAARLSGGGTRGRDVYSLYAISNGASLLALAGYPFIMEPLWGVLQQSQIWERLFAVEVLLILAIALGVKIPDSPVVNPQPNVKPRRLQTLVWLAWSAAGVMVLTSASGYIGQEIAAIPMLWVIPLSLYLLTWILAFSGTVRPGVVARGCLALAALIMIILAVDFRLSLDFRVKLSVALVGMVLACFCVHASLYNQRPEKDQLTRFYAAVTSGGAMGGIFAGVLAVQIFQNWRDLALAFGLVALLACGELMRHLRVQSLSLASLLLIGCCSLFVATGMERPGLIYKHRDFHGQVRVVEEDVGNPNQHRRVLYHGATIHGSQFLNSPMCNNPTTYFGRGTGAAIAVHTQRTMVGANQGLNIGVVGLGVGTMATYLRGQDSMRFYELSPVVAELSQGHRSHSKLGYHFSYLDDAAGETEVVIGDARLSLASELAENSNGNSFDLLVLDAFSGDAVPFHLLTREAFSLFTKHLSNEGIIAAHVSSNWVDLVPVLYAWADSQRWQALAISTRGNSGRVSENHAVWVVLFRNQATLKILARQCRPLMAEGKIIVQNLCNVEYGNLRPWTDNRSDLLALMRSEIKLQRSRVDRPSEIHPHIVLQPVSPGGGPMEKELSVVH